MIALFNFPNQGVKMAVTVFLKSDVESTTKLAQFEAAIAEFLKAFSPTTIISDTFIDGDYVINITEQQRHTGAAAYHIFVNNVPIAICSPRAAGRDWGHFTPAFWTAPKKFLGKVIAPAKQLHPDLFTPGLITDICHELAEMLSDKDTITYTQDADANGMKWLYEPCDWVFGTYWAKTVAGNVCVFPNVAYAKFGIKNSQGPWDLLGITKGPFQCPPRTSTVHPYAYGIPKDANPATAVPVKVV
jgi:hypothetical protein